MRFHRSIDPVAIVGTVERPVLFTSVISSDLPGSLGRMDLRRGFDAMHFAPGLISEGIIDV